MKKIPPFKLIPEPLDAEAEALPKFKAAGGEIGNRHQLGGSPSLIQHTAWPHCPECGEKMTFYAQLDSINDEICLADCGMIYVFVCIDCLTSSTIIQSY